VLNFSPRGERIVMTVVMACWLVAVCAGLGKVWVYANTPGRAADAPMRWPETSHLTRQPGKPTLVMLLHPQCSCSRASVGELALLMARVPGRVTAHVLFYRPANAGPDWGASELRAEAESIPGVIVSTDVDGDESARLGGYVSGQTLLFDAGGELVFAGGMTFARGHSGDNAGRDAVTAIIGGKTPATRRTPVFGCYIGRPKDSV
jgi:hypothetical protein